MNERFTEITDLADDDHFVYDHQENRKVTYEDVIDYLNAQDELILQLKKDYQELFMKYQSLHLGNTVSKQVIIE